jgi:hypothetical protein
MRLASLVLVLCSAACVPVGVLSVAPEDSAVVEGDTDTDTDADTDIEPQADYSVWNGTRTFYYDYAGGCEDTVTETGEAIQEGDSEYEELAAVCPSCDFYYSVNVDPDEVCGWVDIATETYRGLQFFEDTAIVWRLDYGEATEVDQGSFDGWTIDYFYEIDDYWMEVTGQVVFPEAE